MQARYGLPAARSHALLPDVHRAGACRSAPGLVAVRAIGRDPPGGREYYDDFSCQLISLSRTVTPTSVGSIPSKRRSVLSATPRVTLALLVFSGEVSFTAVTVTSWSTFQFSDVKTSDVLSIVICTPSAALTLTGMVTLAS